jgi:leucyl-tRNA synthetase
MKKMKYWLPVDIYNGGMEHTTLHLLYSRFWYKALYDLKLVPGPEPFKKRVSHGMVLAADGKKMSKSLGNVVNPDQVVKEYGADTLRLYEMFMGPFDQAIPWDTQGIKGVRRFLDKVWRLSTRVKETKPSLNTLKKLHQTIKKVSEDIETFNFNTAISYLMELANHLGKLKTIPLSVWRNFLIILAPFAPHITEELWSRLGFKKSIHQQKWPKYNAKLIIEENFTLIVQVNGKLRAKLIMRKGVNQKEAQEKAQKHLKVAKHLKGKRIKKIVFVPDRLINFVVE